MAGDLEEVPAPQPMMKAWAGLGLSFVVSVALIQGTGTCFCRQGCAAREPDRILSEFGRILASLIGNSSNPEES
jgi:hypothetical protein